MEHQDHPVGHYTKYLLEKLSIRELETQQQLRSWIENNLDVRFSIEYNVRVLHKDYPLAAVVTPTDGCTIQRCRCSYLGYDHHTAMEHALSKTLSRYLYHLKNH